VNIDPTQSPELSDKLEAARAAFFEYWVAMVTAARAHGVKIGAITLGHVLDRNEQDAVRNYCLVNVQQAKTMVESAERTKRLRAAYGYAEGEEPRGPRFLLD
jgi:hypothetical protein